MNTSAISTGTPSAPVRHPEPGRRYTIEELRSLADQGDAWALCRVDEWELEFANEYTGTLSERCTDSDCEGFGEPVDVCCDQSGRLIDVDHGDWSHGVSWVRAA